MKPPYPSMTPTWHNDTYPSIDPISNPALSVTGKTIVITGAGDGQGLRCRWGISRRPPWKDGSILAGDGEHAGEGVKATTCVADVTDEQALKKAASAIGKWDVLVVNAGYLPTVSTIGESDSEDWWKGFETNVKGTMLTTKIFMPTASDGRPVILGLTTGAICLPPAWMPGNSSYSASKLAVLKLLEFVAAEHSHAFVAAVHPGLVLTEMTRKAGNDKGNMPIDDVKLPAHFMVWLASEEANFLRGKLVWANWDVDELKKMREEIKEQPVLTANVVGWPHPHVG